MLAVLGDLVEDVVVELVGPINAASDTAARITRRRGGSAANVAATAAASGCTVRFLGQVGDDLIGRALLAELDGIGVDVSHARRRGATGTIVALVDGDGERSMLTDRRTCGDLTDPDPRWLDAVVTLHVPLYSLADGATARTAATTIEWAHDRSIAVSIDLSSSAVIAALGAERTRAIVRRAAPAVVFANADEATAVGVVGVVDGFGPHAITVVKRGSRAARIHRNGAATRDVPVDAVVAGVDTTGAGDAFAAGFLCTPGWADDPVSACAAGHRAAGRLLTSRVVTVAR